MPPKTKKRAAPASTAPDVAWEDVADAHADAAVLKAVKEVEAFWTHGDIDASQVQSARVRVRGSGRRTKTNTDYQIHISVEEVVYKAAVKGEGNAKLRDPVKGRIWVTQPCVVCHKDDNEDELLLCGTDEEEAPVPGCNRSHHTFCVGLAAVPEDDWWCEACEAKRV